ncbi:MAG: hypothetical protein AB8B82_04145 [Roseovarius sp.]
MTDITHSPPMPAPGAPPPDARTLQVTRSKVRELLDRTDAFQHLPPEDRREIAKNMVEIGSYMADPDGVMSAEQSADAPLAQPMRGTDSATKNTARRAGADQGFAGEDFEGGAIEQGTEQFGELIGHVDFASFVGGLIENVFQAIVTSSIDQMKAYSEMLKSVSQSVSDFARDNITENNARDWLVESYPDVFDLSTGGGGGFGFDDGGGGPQLTVIGDNAEVQLGTVSQDLNMAKPITDISDAESEAALVRGARMSMAQSRMQLLASMVMLGISRIVVTDGQIKAKVVFGMRASDVAARKSKASSFDRKKSRSGAAFGGGGLIGGLFGFGGGASRSDSHVTTVGSSLDERSTSQAEVKAQLSGDVRVNFKSDYLPMSSLASPEMIAAIQGNAAPQAPATPQDTSGQTGSDGTSAT